MKCLKKHSGNLGEMLKKSLGTVGNLGERLKKSLGAIGNLGGGTHWEQDWNTNWLSPSPKRVGSGHVDTHAIVAKLMGFRFVPVRRPLIGGLGKWRGKFAKIEVVVTLTYITGEEEEHPRWWCRNLRRFSFPCAQEFVVFSSFFLKKIEPCV